MTIPRARATTVVVVASLLTLVSGYLNKARCAGSPFSDLGRSLMFESYKNTRVCYSDIQMLWVGRGIDQHVFPYLHGGITEAGQLIGGTVEYPVLSGVLMWFGAIGSHTDAAFLLHSALLLAPFGLITAWLLGRLTGWRALWWSLSPAVVLFAFHNWDLPAVATVVGAVYVMTRLRADLRTRGMIAAGLLAVGACLKLYPGLFVIPVALAVLCGTSMCDRRLSGDADSFGDGSRPPAVGEQTRKSGKRRFDVRGAAATIGVAVAVTVLVNLPFAVLGYEGWRASFTFQGRRTADITTNSIWYWGLRPLIGEGDTYDTVVAIASPALVVASFVLALWLGWRISRHTGTYPWLTVSAAMLCGFLLLHKVHSPQYVLWLLPFFVLIRVRWTLIAGYLVANTALGIALFRYYAALGSPDGATGAWETVVLFGVWGQALLLVVLFFRFLRSPTAIRRRAPLHTRRRNHARPEPEPARPIRSATGPGQP